MGSSGKSNLEKDLKSISSLDWLYHLHFIRGETEECKKQIDRFEYKSEYSWYLKGLIFLRTTGDVKSALQCFNQIHSRNNVTFLRAIAKCHLLLGNHVAVVELVRDKGLVIAPLDWQLWYTLGLSYLHLNNIPLAKDAFQHSIQSTNKSDPFLALCKCYLIEEDLKGAIFVLRKASEVNPDDYNITAKLGILLRFSGNQIKGNEKIIQLQHPSASNAGNLTLALSVGAVLQEWKQDLEGALYRYKVANIFESPHLWNNVSISFSSRKKYVAAVSCLKRAVYLNPFDWRFCYNLGLNLLILRQYASSFHFLRAAASISNGEPNVMSLLACCLEQLEDQVNTKSAHLKAAKKAMDCNSSPIPILNCAIYLFNQDEKMFRDSITELLAQFENSWSKKKESGDQESEVSITANRLANAVNIESQLISRAADGVAVSSLDNINSSTTQGDLNSREMSEGTDPGFSSQGSTS